MTACSKERRSSRAKSEGKKENIQEHVETKESPENRLVKETTTTEGKTPPAKETSTREETMPQAIPTAELLYIRRASLHVPLSSSMNLTTDTNLLPTSELLEQRRASFSMRDLIKAVPDETELEHVTPEMLQRRRSTLHIPSKLAQD